MVAIKTKLQERAALVGELHPDKTRQIELQLQEEGSRTVREAGRDRGRGQETRDVHERERDG